MDATELMTEAVSLPLEERARLVDALLQTLHSADDSVTAAWLKVTHRRLDELRSGRVAAIPGEAVFEKVRMRLEQ